MRKLKYIANGLFILFVFGALLFSFSNVRASKNGGVPSLFKTGYLSVLTDSMKNEEDPGYKIKPFAKGSLALVNLDRNGNNSTLKVGEVVVIRAKLDGMEKVGFVIHRIVEIVPFSEEKTGYRTKGDHPLSEIDKIGGQVANFIGGDIIGVVKQVIPNLGKSVAYLQSPLGFGMVIVLPSIFLLLIEMIGFVRAYGEFAPKKSEEEIRRQIKEQLIAEGLIKGEVE